MEATLWPFGKCKKCANKNYCAWSESEILNCMNNGYPNFSPMRNADHIRAMTDEELAEFICKTQYRDGDVCPPTHNCALDKNCEKCWLDWLKEEATE